MKYIKNTVFRFLCIYFILTIAPWLWLGEIPGVSYIIDFYNKGMQWIVTHCNNWFLHVKNTLNLEGYGSGDTSYAWAEFYTIIILSFVVAVIWTVLDKKKTASSLQKYLLYNLVRYNLIMVAFSYGIIKLFALQMSFPGLSQLATPLGDLLPMRFCWMYMGYSVPYQTFSGIIEVIVGILLLYRRTIPLGVITGLGVFIHVFVLNLCFDIPVKLYSMQIVLGCFFLFAIDSKRYFDFFFFNKVALPTTNFDFYFVKRWQRISRIVLKVVFIIATVGLTFYESWSWYQQDNSTDKQIIKQGVYTIKTFKKNNEIVPIVLNDTLAWKDFIFDNERLGSINTKDTLFRKLYGRGYFTYEIDKSKQSILFRKMSSDTINLFVMKYKIIDKNNLQLKGLVKNDTLYYELVKSDRKFPLAERQFHWISEANR